MTRRITATIIAVVIAATSIVGIGTTLLSYRSGRQKARQEVTDLTRNLVDVARLSRTPPIGASNNCDSFKLPARKKACEQLKATAADTAAAMVAEREQMRVSFRLEGIAFILYDVKRATPIDASGAALASVDLPTGIDGIDVPFNRLVAGESVDGVRNGLAFAAAGAPLEARSNIYVIIVATQRLDPLLGPTFRWFALSAAFAVAAAGLIAWRLARRLSRPVIAATVTTQAIAAGDLDARIDASHGDDELAVLSRSINTMADSLQRSRGLEQQFLMSVSHDLRTPLTNISGYAEALSDGAMDDPARAAEVIRREAGRLDRLVADLLDLAKLDSNEFRFHLHREDVTELVESVVGGFRPEAAACGLTLTSPSIGPMYANVDADRLGQIVANLISNALKYAHHSVSVSTDRDAGDVRIVVADDGIGIGPDDLPHVFERLYRAHHQPARKESGSGLGLAIVSQLARGMMGSVAVRSTQRTDTTPGRTEFEVRLPATD